MTGQYIKQILTVLQFTTKQKPNIIDRFWQDWDMITAWKENMFWAWTLGWVSCLDESISSWINRNMFPDVIFCPGKPFPFGNEHHKIAGTFSGNWCNLKSFEGSNQPWQMCIEFEDMESTIDLITCFTKNLCCTSQQLLGPTRSFWADEESRCIYICPHQEAPLLAKNVDGMSIKHIIVVFIYSIKTTHKQQSISKFNTWIYFLSYLGGDMGLEQMYDCPHILRR